LSNITHLTVVAFCDIITEIFLCWCLVHTAEHINVSVTTLLQVAVHYPYILTFMSLLFHFELVACPFSSVALCCTFHTYLRTLSCHKYILKHHIVFQFWCQNNPFSWGYIDWKCVL
jgi:hypothetical protein